MSAIEPRIQDEWLWGWDPTPGIVSVWAESNGQAIVWRRIPETGALVREVERFRPWLLLDRLDDLTHLGPALAREDAPGGGECTYRELSGPGELRFLVARGRRAHPNECRARRREPPARPPCRTLRDLEDDTVLALPPEEQYLVATGRTYFRDLTFDDLQRLQFDLETTGLNPGATASS